MTPKIREALAAVGARFKRHRKHYIFETPEGKNIVVASTPSDRHAEANALRQIAKVSGVEPERPIKNPDRRRKPGRRDPDWSVPINGLAQAAGEISQHLFQAQAHTIDAQVEQLIEMDRLLAEERERAATAERRAAEAAQRVQRRDRELQQMRDNSWVKLGMFVGAVQKNTRD